MYVTICKFFRQFPNIFEKVHSFENSRQNDVDFLLFNGKIQKRMFYNAVCGVDKMKKYDLVLLKNAYKYKKYNLTENSHGIVTEINFATVSVLFFNDKNVGEYIISEIDKSDVEIMKEKLPSNIIAQLNSQIKKIKQKSKEKIEPQKIANYTLVELVSEKPQYVKNGVHKGDRGVVIENNAIENFVEVDFSEIDEDGNYSGDCIAVNLDDLKILE